VKLLLLGGTKFLGRAIAEAALARGHELTLFTRGRTNPGLFPEAEHVRGDRAGDLSALEGRAWEAVVDTSGYVPRVVRASAELLAASAEHYTFVSSGSVYVDGMPSGYDETWPVIQLDDPEVEEVRDDTYGGLKALCEQVVEASFPGRAALLRAGLIVGPHDPTGRFTYWAHRVAGGGEVLAPGPPERRIQFVDVRDLGDWIVRLAEERMGGTFNAVGRPLAFAELLEAARAATDSDAHPVWVDEELLLTHEVGSWQELPLWLPQTLDVAHFLEADASRAITAGLTFRPVEETVRGALEQAELVPGVGLDARRERELLQLWHGR
jgi:2'-hydroxyisoflavone reductase